MPFDSHCHIWQSWPYEPAVPDPATRAGPEQLLYEMDRNAVERAVVICAAIGDNPRNTDYAFESAARHSGRLVIFPDIECRWQPHYQTPGAARRLEQALARWDFVGFTLYPRQDEDCSWFQGEDGSAFFSLAAEHRLIASLSVLPHHLPAVIALAQRHPTMPILCHHLIHFGATGSPSPTELERIAEAAAYPNILVKVSGMGNVTTPDDEFPYPRLAAVLAHLRQTFTPDRLLWGSDYPVSRPHMTYRQTLSMVLNHLDLYGPERDAVLGGNLERLLERP